MFYKIISRYQIKLQDVPNVVHPSLINTYLRKYSIRRMLEMDEVLVIDHLPKSDGVLDHLGDVKRDIPFTLSGYLKNIVDETECGVLHSCSISLLAFGTRMTAGVEPRWSQGGAKMEPRWPPAG
jgi:hypothetical protein